MGCPFLPFFDIVLMANRECKILNSTQSNSLFSGRRLNQFLDFIQHSLNIKFTLEDENNNCVNFLYNNIRTQSEQFEFPVYRKPTYTDTKIPHDLLHLITHKLAEYHSMIHKAYTIRMLWEMDKNEINTIKYKKKQNNTDLLHISETYQKKTAKVITKNTFCSVSYKTCTSTATSLLSSKETTPIIQISDIYTLTSE